MPLEQRAPLNWQLGYQKSGNTWLCFILAGLLGRVPEDWGALPSIIPNWDEVYAKKTIPEYGWVRGHLSFDPLLFGNVPGVLYIERHPFDVMLSAFRHRVYMDGIVCTKEEYVDSFIKNEGDPAFRDIGSGTWRENIESWHEARDSGLPVCILKYEDMKADIWKALRPVTDSKVYSDDLLQAAIEGADISRMKKLDTQNFMGKGKSGGWKEQLTEQQVERAARVFGPTMKAIGYDSVL